jgi:hypothetical protein
MRPLSSNLILRLMLCSITVLAFDAKALRLPDEVGYNRDIRPIFSGTCFNCHGPDKAKTKGHLQLHSFANATGRRSYTSSSGRLRHRDPAIVPFSPEDSPVWQRLNDKDDVMPPEDFHLSLSERKKLLVQKWIKQGAQYEDHWAYQEIESSPSTRNPSEWVDRSINQVINEKALPKPLPSANKRVLIRRLSLDLRGHIPSTKEVADFEADRSKDSWERLVDRFLADPSYGEKMAVHWLDLVRYGDTVGFYADEPVDIFPYRDYVIKAFNDNKPFDLFTQEQIGGDLIPDATLEQKVAASYNRLSMMTSETGVNEEEYIVKYTTDRVKNVSAVWMASTLACAQCHDHKYDPFTMKDFYSMGAFFADINQRGYRMHGCAP